ncbi:hypothetical protein NQ314_017886 [Rhamnusium bicolor]|uniref:Partial AB-hydrolase lipase domain-containing protein n=1 Tax=Rhamnusium bicolor TaxID=1586634 RepID=A0AAV8WT60_9CUCU|nr:hypothetical protein NQ314_017886 [Rhamnusium bicolor]
MRKNRIQILHKYGYPVEVHTIVTDDGYILTAYRIPRGRNGVSSRSNSHPIMLVHGTCGSSENFIVAGPGKAIAYYLADRDFDVWLLNTRGNGHSRRHRTLNADTDIGYWDFG